MTLFAIGGPHPARVARNRPKAAREVIPLSGKRSYASDMPSTEGEATNQGWIVVCVRCLRIKRDGVWTDDHAADAGGTSSGFCDSCAKAERERHGLSLDK
jgi:hypothetical protein